MGLELALGLLFAVLLNERFRGNLAARLAMILPWALLTVSNGVLWAWILNPTYGVVNAMLVSLGILQAPKAWLSDTFWTMNVIILADAWKTVPNMTLLLLAGCSRSPTTCTRRPRWTARPAGRSSPASPCRCCAR